MSALADKLSRAEIHLCPLWSNSRQKCLRSNCPFCAKRDVHATGKARRLLSLHNLRGIWGLHFKEIAHVY